MNWKDFIMHVDVSERFTASQQWYWMGKQSKLHVYEMFNFEPPKRLYDNKLEFANTIKDVVFELIHFYSFFPWQILNENYEIMNEDGSGNNIILVLNALDHGAFCSKEYNKGIILEMMSWNGYHALEEIEVVDEKGLPWMIIRFKAFKEIRPLREERSLCRENLESLSPEGGTNVVEFEPDNYLVATSAVLYIHSYSVKLGGIIVFSAGENCLQRDELEPYLEEKIDKGIAYKLSNVFKGHYIGKGGEMFCRESMTLELYGADHTAIWKMVHGLLADFGMSRMLIFDANRADTFLLYYSIRMV